MTVERYEIDGDVFEVTRERRGLMHRFECTWVAGRHRGDLGFSGFSIGGPMSRKDMRQRIVGFLAQVNPETGFVD